MRKLLDAKKGFTLIELLIVVLIIAILAAIAVPNFLEFQTRAKVSTVYSDFRTMKTAMEAYYIDNDAYPLDRSWPPDYGVPEGTPGWGGDYNTWVALTTPVSYISSVIYSPFKSSFSDFENPVGASELEAYRYWHKDIDPAFGFHGGIIWMTHSCGPNGYDEAGNPVDLWEMDAQVGGMGILYNPTNGTVSRGDLIMTNKRLYQ